MKNSQLSPPTVTPADAADELLRRRNARRHLLDFTTYTYHRYAPDPAHRLIADTLMEVVSGQTDRLIITAPPQTGKSELVSVRLPAFWLGVRPDDPVILSSYAAALAVRKAKAARGVVESDAYQRLFPDTQLKRDSKAAEMWNIDGHTGYMLSAGVDGPVTGNGAMLGIIDDPFSSWAEAQSQTMRLKVWDWWQGTFRTRIWDGGAVVVIMTRWHQNDLVGEMVKTYPGRWKVLRLPMIAETQEERDEINTEMYNLPAGIPDPLNRQPGEVLTPTRFSPAYVEEIRSDYAKSSGGLMVFSAEYQGAPKQAKGNLVKRDWLPIVGAAPRRAKRVRYWDKAGTSGAGDWTVGLLMAEADGVYYIEDVVRGQWSLFERQKVILQTAILDTMRYGKIVWLDEDDSLDLSSDPFELRKRIHIEVAGLTIYIEQEGGSGGKDSAALDISYLAGFDVKTEKPVTDKLARASGWRSQAEAGNIKLVNGAWNYTYIAEVTTVPFSDHDDQWDTTSGAFNRLARPRTTRIGVSTA